MTSDNNVRAPLTRIAFFGTISSGKTSLLQAFHHAITSPKIEVSAKKSLELKLFSEKGIPITNGEISVASVRATRAEEPQEISFVRELNEQKKGRNRLADYLNEHRHNISTLDHPGGFFNVASKEEGIESMLDIKYWAGKESEVAWNNLEEAHGIIVVLDFNSIVDTGESATIFPTSEPDDDDEGLDISLEDTTDEVTGRTFNRTEHARIVRRLMLLKSLKGRKIAICMNKTDMMPQNVARREPGKLIEHYFGDPMMGTIQGLRDHFGIENVRLFKLSALGRFANNMQLDGKLVEGFDEWWYPEGVTDPFLWIFGEREKQSVIQEAHQSALGQFPILRRFREREYLNYYIPYE